MTLSYHLQSNGQVKACIKFVKCIIKKYRHTNNDIYFALFQIRSIPLGTELPSPAMMLFNRSIKKLLLQIGREPVNANNDEKYYKANQGKKHTLRIMILAKTTFFSAGSTVVVQMEDRDPQTP